MIKENNVYLGDTIEIMKKIKDKSIQLILTSPPYNLSYRKDNNKYNDTYDDNKTESEYIQWTISIFKEYERILKDKGVVAYNMSYNVKNPGLIYKVIYEILSNSGFDIVDTCVWKKKNVMLSPANPNRLTRICEFVYIFVKKEHTENFDCNKRISKISPKGQKYYEIYNNFLETKNNDKNTDFHKATFSTDFAKYFIDLYSFENSIVLDNFIGTGTTAIAAIELNRKYIGIDSCEKYIEYSKERIVSVLNNDQFWD